MFSFGLGLTWGDHVDADKADVNVSTQKRAQL